eukprot:4961631-Pyramimonas_sp.AAC.3
MDAWGGECAGELYVSYTNTTTFKPQQKIGPRDSYTRNSSIADRKDCPGKMVRPSTCAAHCVLLVSPTSPPTQHLGWDNRQPPVT